MMSKLKTLGAYLLILAIGALVFYFLFVLPKQMKAVTSDRTVFQAKPGITCVQVSASDSIALSCVRE